MSKVVFCEKTNCVHCSKRRKKVQLSNGEERLFHTCTAKWLDLIILCATDLNIDSEASIEDIVPGVPLNCVTFEEKGSDKE